MKLFKTSTLLVVTLAAALAGCAQNGVAPSASAVATQSVASKTQVQRVAPAPALYELAYSARQKAVFVASAGRSGENAAPSKVLRLDPQTLAVQAEIPMERRGFGLALDDAANRLYVGNGSDASVTVIDTAANRVAGVVQLAEKVKVKAADGKETERSPYHMREMVVDAQRGKLYIPAMHGEGSVLFIVDTAAMKLERTVQGFGLRAMGIVLDAARSRLFVANSERQVVVFDTAQQKIVNRWETGAEQPLNLAYDASSNRVLVVDQGLPKLRGVLERTVPGYQSTHPGNRLLAHDADTGAVAGEMPAHGPVTLLLDGARKRLYVTNRAGGTVSVFDSGSYRLLESIALPTHPNSLALDAASGTVFVSIKNGAQDARGNDESVARLQL